MASSLLPTVRVINSFEVSPPAGSFPTHAVTPLTFFDVMWVDSHPVECLFFYPCPNSNSNSDDFVNIISSLRSSLSHTLKSFYPLAGKLQCRTDGINNIFEVVYSEGDSVSFVVSECTNSLFDKLSGSSPRRISHLQPFVPSLPISVESQKLFAVQVTVFPGEGIVIGTSIHHAACDGNSLMQFMRSWAATCLTGSFDSSLNPIIDRTLVPDPFDLCTMISQTESKVTIKDQANSESNGNGTAPHPVDSSDNLVATFTLDKENIKTLKQFISNKAEQMKKVFHCSTIVVSLAFTWVCYVKSREEESGTKKAGLLVPADFRARIEPPLPTAYFGNCIGPCMVQADQEDIFSNDGIVLAAEVIGKAIGELSYGENFAHVLGSYHEFLRNAPLMTMAWSPRFKVYELDFGLGKLRKFEMVSAAKEGETAFADSREVEGGVEISIALNKTEMDSFKKYFVTSLKFEK